MRIACQHALGLCRRGVLARLRKCGGTAFDQGNHIAHGDRQQHPCVVVTNGDTLLILVKQRSESHDVSQLSRVVLQDSNRIKKSRQALGNTAIALISMR